MDNVSQMEGYASVTVVEELVAPETATNSKDGRMEHANRLFSLPYLTVSSYISSAIKAMQNY
ncbi:unnamed protein product [Callosobruchus maculatus]|uniref:Uncharacterized protein n=1 Tax=Callosobruchus maculatus TaxID=64391 RepID=A0A653BK66_CALMS|nr:unnamed protein product [Callosobruchus maculatus]